MASSNRLAGAALVVALLAACHSSATTAHLGSFKLGRDKDVTVETSTFGTRDEVWAKTEADAVSGKASLQFGLILVKVTGQPENLRHPGVDHRVELAASGTGTYHLTPPPSGWPTGKYRVEVAMINTTGKQTDQKTADFTVGAN